MFLNNRWERVMLSPTAAGGAAAVDQEASADDPVTTEEAAFETWLAGQSEDIRTQFQAHTAGLVSALKKERKAAGEVPVLKKKVGDYEAKEEEVRKAQLSREETLAEENAQSKARETSLKLENQRLRIDNAVEREASKLGFMSPEDALKLLPEGAVKIEEDGKVVGHAEALKELLKAKPYLAKPIKPEKETKGPGSFTGTRGVQDEKKDLVVAKVPARARL